MFAYIKGKLEMKMTGYVVIDVGGLGYKIFMSELGIENIGNIGDIVKAHTYYRVRAKTALTMLAVCEPSEFALAVISEDVKALTRYTGYWTKICKKNNIRIERQNKERTRNRKY